MASENETVEDIVKEMRGPYYKMGRSNARIDHDMMGYMSFIANRIEAAHKREKAELQRRLKVADDALAKISKDDLCGHREQAARALSDIRAEGGES